MSFFRSCLAVSTLVVLSSTAAADTGAGDDVPAITSAPDGHSAVSRGVQNPAGLLSARLTLAVNLSSDRVGKPISLVPNLYYGVTDRLQLGLVHDGPMRWQSRPGLGLCLSGSDGGCPSVYDNIGLDAMFGLLYGQELHLSAHGALYLTSFDPASAMVALGVTAKIHVGDSLAIYADPQLGLAVNERDVRDDALFMPIELQYQAGVMTSLKLLTGVSGSLSAFGDTVEVPVGIGAVRSLTEHVDLGVRFSFDNLLGHQVDGVGRADQRSLALLLALRR
jgi:hypothetical protein